MGSLPDGMTTKVKLTAGEGQERVNRIEYRNRAESSRQPIGIEVLGCAFGIEKCACGIDCEFVDFRTVTNNGR